MQIKERLVQSPNQWRAGQEVLFLVYGTLKQGFHNHVLLKSPSVEYLGEFATEPRFTMVSCGGFPAVHCEGETSIHGELYRTSDPHVINMVFGLEGYSGRPSNEGGRNPFYDVEFVDTPHGKASMFVFRREIRNPIVDGGKW